MERKEVIINDIVKASQRNDCFTTELTADKWEVVNYKTKFISGTGILASLRCFPENIEINPELKGWYKIYLGIVSDDAYNAINIKLAGDEFSQMVRPGNIDPYINWNHFEVIEESFYKASDMTDKTITLGKPDIDMTYSASLMWIRFVPMSDEEVKIHLDDITNPKYKNIYAHMDTDFTWLDKEDYSNVHNYCKNLYNMKDSHVKVVAQEVFLDINEESPSYKEPIPYAHRRPRGENVYAHVRLERWKSQIKNADAIIKEQVNYAHKYNMEFFIAHRMSLGNGVIPFAADLNRVKYYDEHPEFSCMSRDGKRLSFMSFAYDEIQDFVVEKFNKFAKNGIDGITLIFTRGLFVAFEQPVIDLFKERYGDEEDIRTLPYSDPRVGEIKSEFMTRFIRKLRNSLDKISEELNRNRIKIYITAYCSMDDFKNEGISVEALAKEKLIDGVVQSNMTVWEDIEGCIDENGKIDLAKYEKKAEDEFIIKRAAGNELERNLAGLVDYNRIAEEYGIKIYSEIQWENSVQPPKYKEAAENLLRVIKGNVALWDCYPHRVSRLCEWHVTSKLSSLERIEKINPDEFRTVYKVLNYEEEDMRYHNPNWVG